MYKKRVFNEAWMSLNQEKIRREDACTFRRKVFRRCGNNNISLEYENYITLLKAFVFPII